MEEVQMACFHTFSNIHWHAGKSHWYLPTCKSHIFQAVLRGALPQGGNNSELTEIMKRGPEAESATLYVLTTDPALKYQPTLAEKDFLKKLHLEDFITSNSWGVLQPQLVTEAIAALEPTTFLTTVKGESVQIIAKNWREQFQQTFHLTQKKPHPVTREWQPTELFPSLKENPERKDTVHISDCHYPGARRPLRLLSSLLCLNLTHQNHITLAFVDMVIAALNGQGAGWPKEFYHEISKDLTTLHNKHLADRVKVENTSIGSHLTLILKVGGFLNIKEELRAGYRSERLSPQRSNCPIPRKLRRPKRYLKCSPQSE